VQALRLSGTSYEIVATLDATTTAILPPFAGLTLDPATVWR